MLNAVYPTGQMHVPRQTSFENLRTLTTAATQGILPALVDAWRTHGDLCELRLGPLKAVLVVQPTHVRQVMVEDRSVFIKSAGVLTDRVKSFFGEGLLTSEGEHWRKQRRLLQPAFTVKAVTQFSELMLDEADSFLVPTLREAAQDHHIGGRRIRKGTLVILSPFLTQRHPDLWASPETFNPERFVGEAGKQVNRYAYFPFGAGPRTCLGIHFAMLEGLTVLATVAQNYRLEHADAKPIQPIALGSLRPAEPIRMKLVPRESQNIAGKSETRTPAGSGTEDTEAVN